MDISRSLEHDTDELVNRAMQTWNVPGLAIAIVKDDRVLVQKGYGVRQLGKQDRIDEHTLFAIASNTKSFTATAIGLLVQEGKLAWDDPVRKYLPDFQLYDQNATEMITIRDLLCHRSGLGTWAGDVLQFSNYSTEEVVRRVRYIPPDFSFRAGYGYSNLMFVTAGMVIAKISGLSWDDFIRQRIFEPLGMQDGITNPRNLEKHTNVAVPHEDVRGKLQTVIHRTEVPIGAAGSICASVADITLWLRMQLNLGSLDGKRIVDASIIEETRTPHTPMILTAVEKELFPSRHFSAYGLGWFLSDIHGRFIVRHTGGLDGMLSSTLFIPEENIGIAIFTNKLPNSAYILLTHYLIEKLLGLPSRDWIQTYIDLEKKEAEKTDQAKAQRAATRVRDTHPSLALEKFAGEYESLILGGATIKIDGNELRIQLQAHESISGKLEHWHYDTFLCKWDDPVLRESLIPFISNGQGEITEFHVKIREDWIDPLEHIFNKKPT